MDKKQPHPRPIPTFSIMSRFMAGLRLATPANPDTAVVGNQRELFTGFVYFDEEVAAGLYQTETSGTSDDVSEILGLDLDNNNWTERHAAITVLVREGAEQTAE